MLIETRAVAAVVCSRCGRISWHVLSLFSLGKEQAFTCECGFPVLQVVRRNANYWFRYECAFCHKTHLQPFARKDMLRPAAKDLVCQGGDHIAGSVGPEEQVVNRVKSHRRSLTQLALEVGSPDYFENCQVMLGILEKLYGMAELGELNCQCGNHNLELEICPDRLELRCPTCGTELFIPAVLPEDLERFLHLPGIVMGETGRTWPQPPKLRRRRPRVKSHTNS